MRKFAKFWRESASLIILARDGNQVSHGDYNYKVLVFKRTEKTSFMPNSIVFPGGAYDKQDESARWVELFSRMNVPNNLLQALTKVEGPRPFIFENDCTEVLDRNISLRITALREAFEELGVLFGHTDGQAASRTNGFSECFQNFDITSWQKSVHDGEKSFADLCNKLDILPDILNMYEWSTWLTPAMFRKRRFETAFYLIALNEKPAITAEPHEVDQYFWETPAGLLQAHKEEKLWLAPPQCYELTRLSHLYDIDEIVRFAKIRCHKGSPLFCPVQYKCSDAVVFLLPGDDLYPQNYDYITAHDFEKYQNMTAAQLRQESKNLHRTEHTGLHAQVYYQNITPFNGHLSLSGEGTHLAKL
ncbi:acyl-coenzyme A diphosphatase NUDT19-like isoform X1 [Toxorhynchites rutilus septentrionalis]|uniref:acyl-coenzyme A diphosphatase NUDT19-like isoform X1 n=1 Tax=Toxorhynchites rutilus septentrionalis TaxID=329112 RepID=UPI00247AD078|nr:acyl-coenzyme A diphosphatase NUDT19-like isoform X1 [Toxorhynchites rutilus septentrionalis]